MSEQRPRELCQASDPCDKPVFRRGLCRGHYGAALEGRQMSDRVRPGAAFDLVREAALAMAEADSQDDAEWRRADDNLRKASLRHGQRAHREAIRRGMQRAKAEGRHVGRPREASKDDKEIADIVQILGVRRAAEAMQLSKDQVWRAVQRVAKGILSRQSEQPGK